VIDLHDAVNECENTIPRIRGAGREEGSDARVVKKYEREFEMGLILLTLLAALLFAGLGFALHLLWIGAAVLLVVWFVGILVSGAEHSWYRVRLR
jgi:hypothetical protein